MNVKLTWLAALLLTACGSSADEAPQTATTEQPAPDTAGKVVPVTTTSPEARAAFEEGRTAEEAFRTDDALAAYRHALELDPGFASAKAALGGLTPGAEGLELTRQAAAGSAALPEAERTDIEASLAFQEGDAAKGIALLQKVAELAPDDWRAQLHYGASVIGTDLPAATAALTRATELAPEQGAPWNLLGYARAMAKDYDGAIAAFDAYIKADPTEANPYDSKGEILLRAGRLDEAEAAFLKAAEIDPSFWMSLDAAAQARILKGDTAGGFAALDLAEAAATMPIDVADVRFHRAWTKFATGDAAGAEAVLADLDTYTTEHALPAQHASVSLTRAQMAMFAGNGDGTMAQLAEEATRATGLEGADADGLTLQAEALALATEAKAGKIDEAAARLATVDALTTRNPLSQDVGLTAHGALDLARGDAAGAVATLTKCHDQAAVCGMYLAMAQEKAGDAAAAEATRERVRTLGLRDGSYLGVWAAVGGPAHTGDVGEVAGQE